MDVQVYIYITFVRDHFAAAVASTSLSPTMPASVYIYKYVCINLRTYVTFRSRYRLDFVAGGACFLPCSAHREK